MSQGERIRTVRKSNKLTLEKFGKRIGVGKTSISKLENEQVNLTDQMAKSICREFNINEDWLRTGKGEMKADIPEEDAYSRAAAGVFRDNDVLAIEALKLYYTLSPAAKEAARKYILQLADLIRDQEDKI